MAELEIYGNDGEGHISRFGPRHRGLSADVSAIVPGYWGGPGFVLYDRSAGTGDVYRVEADGSLTTLRHYENWRRTWDIIVPGHFEAGTSTDLLFYSRADGIGEFYGLNDSGEMEWGRRASGWRTTWSHIVPGWWSSVFPYTDLLFYERSSGEAHVHSTNHHGRLRYVKGFNIGAGWDLVVPGTFAGGEFGLYTDLLLYNRSAGVGEFHASNDMGMVEINDFVLQMRTDRWRRTWRAIVPGYFAAGSTDPYHGEMANCTDLFFYDADAGEAEFYNVQRDDPTFRFVRRETRVRTTWTHIVPGDWDREEFTNLLFYDATA
jgi:hypothetical protein